MPDHLTARERSKNMSRVRSRDTRPELMVRSLLHRAGYRFRVNRRDLPGKPDIVLPRYETVIFVHGCFWHRHRNCKRTTMPATRKRFWKAKFEQNVARDKRAKKALRKLGWKVIIVWECEVRRDPAVAARRVIEKISGGVRAREMAYELPSKGHILKVADRRARLAYKAKK